MNRDWEKPSLHPEIAKATIHQFDRVRAKATPTMIEASLVGRSGLVYGVTVPSSSGVTVLGPLSRDFAIFVKFDDGETAVWIDESNVELVEREAVDSLAVGDIEWRKLPSGKWIRRTIPKP